MIRELIVASFPGETRTALVEDGAVVELGVDRGKGNSVLHGIYRGRVQRVAPGTQAAFVDLGLRKNGFLQLERAAESEGPTSGSGGNGDGGTRIEDVFRAGQSVLVQVVREPMGDKGYKLTSNLNLQGRFFDFRPGAPGEVVVNEIEAPHERLRLRALGERHSSMDGSLHARASAEQRDEATLAADIAGLEADWRSIQEQAASGKPACLRSEMPMVFRYVRDVLSSGFGVIRVDSEELYARMVNFVRGCVPGTEHNVRYYSRNYPIFDEYGVKREFEIAMNRRVSLPSGGSIVIDQTEALVAIDVNTGRFAGSGAGREEANVATNLEAAAESARQIRLRNLGGIIVIDFIDMKLAKNRARVHQLLKRLLARDPARTKAFPPAGAELCVITRKRERPPLDAELFARCPSCEGTGKIRSLGTTCQDVLLEARKRAGEFSSGVRILTAPGVAGALRQSRLIDEIGALVSGVVEIEEVALEGPRRFRLEPVSPSPPRPPASRVSPSEAGAAS